MPHGMAKREFSLMLPDQRLREITAISHASLNLGHLYKWNLSNRYHTPAEKEKCKRFVYSGENCRQVFVYNLYLIFYKLQERLKFNQ